MTINVIPLLPFLIFSMLNILYEKNNNRIGTLFTKPPLMPFLMLFYLLNAVPVNYFILLALGFGFLGDVFLLWHNRSWCILAGILSFLIGHIFYICVFIEDCYLKGHIPVWFMLFLIPYIMTALILYKNLISSMDLMKFPAMSYMSIVFLMSFMSLSRIWQVSFLSFSLTFLGSLVFIISDSLLAFSMFKAKRKNDGVVVMSTYIIGQLLIIIGLLAMQY